MDIMTAEFQGGRPQYHYPPHYKQPTNVPIYFYPHHHNWLMKMPDLLVRDCVVVEIGALYGGASMFMLDKYVKKTGMLHIIDINTNEYIQNNLLPYKGRYNYMLGDSCDMMRLIPKGCADLVYIDGNHMSKFVLEDAINAFYSLSDGGYIVFDDYGWGLDGPSHCQPKTAVDAFLLAYDKHLKVKSIGWQVIVQKIKYDLTDEEKSSNYISQNT